MTYWLIHPDTFADLRALRDTATGDRLEAAARIARARGGSPILNVADGVAHIEVLGVLTQRTSWLAELFGGGNTTYAAIVEALAQANSDPAVRRIVLDVSSPGGEVAGLFACLDALAASPKPTEAVADGMACSAAFAIGAACGRFVARDRSTILGSVGVAQSFYVSDAVVDVTSTHAPNKRPDVRTDKGKAAVREELDQFHQLFVEAIAKGRGTTTKTVNSDYGRGGVVLAREAAKRGMIDAVEGESSGVATAKRAATAAAPVPKLKRRDGEDDDSYSDRMVALVQLRERAESGEDVDAQIRALVTTGTLPAPRVPPPPQPVGDVGDQIVALMEARSPFVSPKAGPDIGDQIVALMQA